VISVRRKKLKRNKHNQPWLKECPHNENVTVDELLERSFDEEIKKPSGMRSGRIKRLVEGGNGRFQ
jgi:hypothetical protein